MYNFPIIPIILFALMIIPPIIIGFLRGWKAALFIMLATLALIGIEIGVSFAIYDSLWKLLNRFIIDELQPGLSKDALKEIGKSTIIILFIGICMIPTYGLVMAIYFPLNKKLRRHLFPATKEINENQKTIRRSVHWASRTSGMAVSAISGLFFASSASSAAATLFTPIEKRSGFTDFTSDLARLYTFGNGTNDRALQIVNRFARQNLTSQWQDKLASVLYFGQHETKTELTAAITALSNGEFHNKLVEVSQDENSAVAIGNLVLMSHAMMSRPQFFLKDMDYQELFADGTPVGVPEAKHFAYDGTEALINSYSSLPNLHLHLSEGAISSIIQLVKQKTIMPFENTAFYKQWLDGTNFLKYLSSVRGTLTDKLNGLYQTLSQQKGELSNIYSLINKDRNELIALGVTSGVGAETYKYVVPNGAEQTLTLSSRGSIYNDEETLKSLVVQVAAALVEKNNAEADYLPKKQQNQQNEAKKNQDQQDMNAAKSAMDNAQSEYNAAKQARINEEARRDNNRRDYEAITDSILSNFDAQAKAGEAEFNRLVSVLRAKTNTHNTNHSHLSTKEQEYYTAVSSVEGNKQTIENIKNQILGIKNAIGSNSNMIDYLNNKINAKNSAIANFQNQINNLNPATDGPKISQLQNDISSLQSEISSYRTQVTMEMSSKQSNENNLANKQSDLITEQGKTAGLVAEKKRLEGIVNTLRRQDEVERNEIRNLTTQRNAAEHKWKSNEASFNQKTADKARYKSNWDSAIANIPVLKATEKTKLDALTVKQSEFRTAEAKYNSSNQVYNNYRISVFLPSEKNFFNKRDIWAGLVSAKDAKESDLLDKKNRKQFLINDLKDQMTARTGKIANIYSTSDKINDIEGRQHATHTGEDYAPGTMLPNQAYTPSSAKQPQSQAYLDWALKTIPGINDYLVNAGKDTQSFKELMEREKVIYKNLEKLYLDKIASILRT